MTLTGVSFSGSGFFAQQPGVCWSARRWGQVDRVRLDGEEGLSCKRFLISSGAFTDRSEVLSCGV